MYTGWAAAGRALAVERCLPSTYRLAFSAYLPLESPYGSQPGMRRLPPSVPREAGGGCLDVSGIMRYFNRIQSRQNVRRGRVPEPPKIIFS